MIMLSPLALILGCSTILKGKTQIVSINSNVKGADVIVSGITVGKTPYNGPIQKDSSTTVTLIKEGFDTKTATLSTEFEPVFWGNIIFGGFLGSTTDSATGAMYKYAPATIQIDLEKTQAEEPETDKTATPKVKAKGK